jgi:hypothetical protein
MVDSILARKYETRVEVTDSDKPGNTKGGSITVPLTSCLTRLESAVCLLKIFGFICKTD